ncbi:MAG: hypothetical protein ACOVO0_00050, partial [Burkholderiaceae bacterium]
MTLVRKEMDEKLTIARTFRAHERIQMKVFSPHDLCQPRPLLPIADWQWVVVGTRRCSCEALA